MTSKKSQYDVNGSCFSMSGFAAEWLKNISDGYLATVKHYLNVDF
jgi:hypothetical protein